MIICNLSGEAGCMSWLILLTYGTFLWRLMIASAYEVEVSEDDQRLVTSGGWAVWAARAGEPGSVLSVEAEDREEPRLGLGTLEAGVLTSDRVRPQ